MRGYVFGGYVVPSTVTITPPPPSPLLGHDIAKTTSPPPPCGMDSIVADRFAVSFVAGIVAPISSAATYAACILPERAVISSAIVIVEAPRYRLWIIADRSPRVALYAEISTFPESATEISTAEEVSDLG